MITLNIILIVLDDQPDALCARQPIVPIKGQAQHK
jgi:hypothetical protein